MRVHQRLCLIASLLGLLALPALARDPYIRVARDAKKQPRAMQTCVARFVLPAGQRVDLVSVVHVGERKYYQGLNERFRGYDAVLYELILDDGGTGKAPRGPVEIPRDGGDVSLLSQVQMILCNLLGLEFQLRGVNYGARNFVHADMTSSEFRAAMEKSGETPMTLLMRVLQVAMKNPGTVDDRELEKIDIFALLGRPPTPQEQRILRRVFASSFEDVDEVMNSVMGTSIIAGRNGKALRVLARELKAGRRSLALFYGAGHMADFEQRLVKQHGARLERREWLDAWDLTEPPGKP
ncbi:MAG: hypothetical protein FJX76_03485 [Armatimonadetes bacterium]|nr:hypothetical protein [Armatimonadota bacterium]